MLDHIADAVRTELTNLVRVGGLQDAGDVGDGDGPHHHVRARALQRLDSVEIGDAEDLASHLRVNILGCACVEVAEHCEENIVTHVRDGDGLVGGLSVPRREHPPEILGACVKDELMGMHLLALDNEGDVGELRVVNHRLQIAGESEHRLLHGLLQRELKAIVEIPSAVVPSKDEKRCVMHHARVSTARCWCVSAGAERFPLECLKREGVQVVERRAPRLASKCVHGVAVHDGRVASSGARRHTSEAHLCPF
mmetsp:Transcript_17133/g.34682  ORF Transcript_17133/g.34682 Transcript_17133/m.34682 type:complete len:252 (+) Transcript_17133:498-1253(+)